jgi:DNA-binding MarR family transcriptional regulator
MPRLVTKAKSSLQPDSTWRSLIRTFGLVRRVMGPYFADHGISGSQWGMLRVLHNAETAGEGALRLGDISDRLLVRPPSVTGAMDRLIRAGLVRRTASPDDHRVKLVALTPTGREIADRVLQSHADKTKSLLSGLSKIERQQLGRLLDRLTSHLEKFADNGHTASIPKPRVKL